MLPYLQEEEVLAAQKTLVLLGLLMMLFPEALLLVTTTGQQILTPFFWSSLINHSGQMFMFEITPRLLFLYSGVVCRSVKSLASLAALFLSSEYMLFAYLINNLEANFSL